MGDGCGGAGGGGGRFWLGLTGAMDLRGGKGREGGFRSSMGGWIQWVAALGLWLAGDEG